MIRKLFMPPVFENEDDNFRALFINGFIWTSIALLAIAAFSGGIHLNIKTSTTDFSLLSLIVILGFSRYLLQKRNVTASALTIIIMGWIGLTYQAYNTAGVKDIVVIAYISIALLASILLDWVYGGVIVIVSIIVIWLLAIFEANGIIVPEVSEPLTFARDLSFAFIIISVLIYFSTTNLKNATKRATESEANLLQSNKKLQELNQSLENRVAARTTEIEIANQRNEKRARQFEAVAQVARLTATNEQIDELLPHLTSVISGQFGFYHAGIFLLDETRTNAILRASNSEGGKRMVQRKHKLQVGQAGIVGFVSATGTPRIALDVGSDAVFFDNPDLPNTRSEMALPLHIAGEVIGVLDVQSTEPNAFQQADVEVLSTLADQVSIAIQNSRSFEETQQLLKEAQKVSSSYLQDAWQALQSEETNVGYRVSDGELQAFTKPLSTTHVKKAIESKQTVSESGKGATLAIPIRLRNEVIGIMDIRTSAEHKWDEDEVDIAEAVAERLSLALETSLLLKSTQRRAELERVTSEISGKIGATTQFDAILRTAAEELSRVLGGSDVLVQIQQMDEISANPEN